MSRRLLAAVATAALAVGLAACGDRGDGPVTEPPPEINAGSDDGGAGDDGGASDGGGAGDAGGADAGSDDGTAVSDAGGEDDGSTQAAPDIPPPDPADFPGMDENTPEGAEQAVRFYFANVYWGYQTGDSSRLENYYGDGCDTCEQFNSEIEDIGESGNFWGDTGISDFGIKVYESPEFDHEIGYIFTVGEHVEVSPSTGDPFTVEAVDYVAAAGVLWSGDRWIVGGLNVEEA